MSIFSYFQNRKLKQMTALRQRIYRPLAQSGSVLFVFDGGTPGCEEAIRHLCSTLQHLRLPYQGICLDLNRKQRVGSWVEELSDIRVLQRKHLTLFGSPFKKKHPQLQALMQEEFGLFLNLTIQSSYAEACLTAASKAHLKAGLKDAQNKELQKAYDICFAYRAPETDLDDTTRKTFPEWTKKIIDYLTDIKSSTPK